MGETERPPAGDRIAAILDAAERKTASMDSWKFVDESKVDYDEPQLGNFWLIKHLRGALAEQAADLARVTAVREEAQQERDDEIRAGDLHRELNRRTAEALGKPFEGPNSSWHDIPEQVATLRAEHDTLKAASLRWGTLMHELMDERDTARQALEEAHAKFRARRAQIIHDVQQQCDADLAAARREGATLRTLADTWEERSHQPYGDTKAWMTCATELRAALARAEPPLEE